MHLPDPTFPPLLTGHGVRAPLVPATEAIRAVQAGELGAGDVIWARNTTRAELAIILEPDVSLERALQMGPLLTVAVVDALAALCPPKVAILHRWPDAILLNNSVAGEVHLHAPTGPLSQEPAWIVAAANIEIAAQEERTDWSRTSVAEEAGGEITRTDLVEAIAAHFLKRLHHWMDEGFRSAHDDWLMRCAGREAPLPFPAEEGTIEGTAVGLDEAAGIMLRIADGRVRTLGYARHVQWLEPAS